jgi:hypothetical protein
MTLLPLVLSRNESAPQSSNIGLLQSLPSELILVIFDRLPILSLIRFRNASQHARFLIDTMPMFRNIVEHAPQVIRGILAVQTKVEVTLPQVYEKLRQ